MAVSAVVGVGGHAIPGNLGTAALSWGPWSTISDDWSALKGIATMPNRRVFTSRELATIRLA